MTESDSYLLWEDEHHTIQTPKNPATPYSEGLHIFVAPKRAVPAAWDDIELATETFELAAKACAIMRDLDLAPWFNIQANGNWGLLPGRTPFFHVHVHGRNKTASWGKPITLPELPDTAHYDPMPDKDRTILQDAFKSLRNYRQI